MSIVLLLTAAATVAVTLFAPAWRHVAAARFDYISGRLRRSAGRWQARDMQRGAVKAVARQAMVTLNGAYLWNRVEVALAPEDFAHVKALHRRVRPGDRGAHPAARRAAPVPPGGRALQARVRP